MEVPSARWDDLLAGARDARRLLLARVRGRVGRRSRAASRCSCTAGDGGDVVFPLLVRARPRRRRHAVRLRRPARRRGAAAARRSPAPTPRGAAARGVLSTFAVFHPLARTRRATASTSPTLGGTVAWALDGDLERRDAPHHRRLVRRALAGGLRRSRSSRARPTSTRSSASTRRRCGGRARRRSTSSPPPYWEALRATSRSCGSTCRRDGELLASVLGMGAPPWLHYHLGGEHRARGAGRGASQLALLRLAAVGAGARLRDAPPGRRRRRPRGLAARVQAPLRARRAGPVGDRQGRPRRAGATSR